ncbi:unnamed protein product [Trichobilharzia regenti]|nr:unnamed protein product [Trichobilharzia regenti]
MKSAEYSSTISSLMNAAGMGNLRTYIYNYDSNGTLEQLIIYGADLNAQVENHNTPIHLCVLADEPECLKLLLRCGASPTIVNSSGQTPYELAVLIERMHLAMILQTFDEKQIGKL